jgi:hypothetical protein
MMIKKEFLLLKRSNQQAILQLFHLRHLNNPRRRLFWIKKNHLPLEANKSQGKYKQ